MKTQILFGCSLGGQGMGLVSAADAVQRRMPNNTTIVYDGNAVVAYAEVHRPQVIVVNERMDGRSGILVFEWLRTVPDYDFHGVLAGEASQRTREYAKVLKVQPFQLPYSAERIADLIIGGLNKDGVPEGTLAGQGSPVFDCSTP